MRYFQCDYAEGCCPEILAALSETNLQQTVGYGEDEFCGQAAKLIKEACGTPQGQDEATELRATPQKATTW